MHFFSGLITQSTGKLYCSLALVLELSEKDNHKNQTINNVNSYIQQSYQSKNPMNKDYAPEKT